MVPQADTAAMGPKGAPRGEGKQTTRDWKTQRRQGGPREKMVPKDHSLIPELALSTPVPSVTELFPFTATGPLVLEEAWNQQGVLRSEPKQGSHHQSQPSTIPADSGPPDLASLTVYAWESKDKPRGMLQVPQTASPHPQPSISGPQESTERLPEAPQGT